MWVSRQCADPADGAGVAGVATDSTSRQGQRGDGLKRKYASIVQMAVEEPEQVKKALKELLVDPDCVMDRDIHFLALSNLSRLESTADPLEACRLLFQASDLHSDRELYLRIALLARSRDSWVSRWMLGLYLRDSSSDAGLRSLLLSSFQARRSETQELVFSGLCQSSAALPSAARSPARKALASPMAANALWTLGDGAPSLDPSCSEDTGKSSLRSTRSGAAPKKGLGGGSENQLATRLQVLLLTAPPGDDPVPELSRTALRSQPENTASEPPQGLASPESVASAERESAIMSALLDRAVTTFEERVGLFAVAAELVARAIASFRVPSSQLFLLLADKVFGSWAAITREMPAYVLGICESMTAHEVLLVAELAVDALLSCDEDLVDAAGLTLGLAADSLSRLEGSDSDGDNSIRALWVRLHIARLSAEDVADPTVESLALSLQGRLTASPAEIALSLSYLTSPALRVISLQSLETARSAPAQRDELGDLLLGPPRPGDLAWVQQAAKYLTGATAYPQLCRDAGDLFQLYLCQQLGDWDSVVAPVMGLDSFAADELARLASHNFESADVSLVSCIDKHVAINLARYIAVLGDDSFSVLSVLFRKLARRRLQLPGCTGAVMETLFLSLGRSSEPLVVRTLLRLIYVYLEQRVTVAADDIFQPSNLDTSARLVLHTLGNSGGNAETKFFCLSALVSLLGLFAGAGRIEALRVCVEELRRCPLGWSVDPSYPLRLASLLQVEVDAANEGSNSGSGGWLALDSLNAKQREDVLRTLGLLYGDLFGFPVYLGRAVGPALCDAMEPQHVAAVYSYTKYLSHSTDCAISDLREAFRFLYAQPMLFRPKETNAGRVLRSYLTMGESSAASVLASLGTVATEQGYVTDCSDFYWEMYVTTAGASGGTCQLSYKEARDTLSSMEQSILPRIRLLLLDLSFNPLRVASWRNLFDALYEVFAQAVDKASENCQVDTVPWEACPVDIDLDDLLSAASADVADSLRDALGTAPVFVKAGADLLATLLLVGQRAFLLCARIDALLKGLLMQSHSVLGAQDFSACVGVLEGSAFLTYSASSRFASGSAQKELLLAMSFQRFDELCCLLSESHDDSDMFVFASLMRGKLLYHIERGALPEALRMVGRAVKARCSGDLHFADLLYQLHSLRLKGVLSLLETRPDDQSQAVAAISQFSYREVARAATQSDEDFLWALAIDAISALRECRKLDPLESKSVYRIASFVFRAAQLHCVPEWILSPLAALGIEGLSCRSALSEMCVLFDRKRQQVVALWALESTAVRFEQVLQRTAKFDALCKKYLGLYTQLIVLTEDVVRAQDLLAAIAASRKRTSTMDWMLDCAISTLLPFLASAARCPKEELQIAFRIYDSCSSRLSPLCLSDIQKRMVAAYGEVSGEVDPPHRTVVSYCRSSFLPPKASKPRCTGNGVGDSEKSATDYRDQVTPESEE